MLPFPQSVFYHVPVYLFPECMTLPREQGRKESFCPFPTHLGRIWTALYGKSFPTLGIAEFMKRSHGVCNRAYEHICFSDPILFTLIVFFFK